jgi:hypothetical protein
VTRVTGSNNRIYRPAPTAYSRDLQSRSTVNGFSNGNNSRSTYSPSNSSYSTRPSSNSGGFSSQPVRSYSAPSGGGGGMSSRPSRH